MGPQVRYREFRFPVGIAWEAVRCTVARVDGKAPLPIAAPPGFGGTDLAVQTTVNVRALIEAA
jgi:hypothetical protein